MNKLATLFVRIADWLAHVLFHRRKWTTVFCPVPAPHQELLCLGCGRRR
jgi:hypothetical protein